jgi:hypothetical protein
LPAAQPTGDHLKTVESQLRRSPGGRTDPVRAGLDWKYALGLQIDDPGIDHSVLCEFRTLCLTGEISWASNAFRTVEK